MRITIKNNKKNKKEVIKMQLSVSQDKALLLQQVAATTSNPWIRENLTEDNIGLIFALAHRKARYAPSSIVDINDLFQEGFIGYLNAEARFKPEKKYAFNTYSNDQIAARMNKYIDKNINLSIVPEYCRQQVRKAQKLNGENNYIALRKKSSKTKKAMTTKELERAARNSAIEIISLDRKIQGNKGKPYDLYDTIPSPNHPEKKLHLKMILISIMRHALSDDEKNYLCDFYGINSCQKTQTKIAKERKLTKACIGQTVKRAEKKLQKFIKKHKIAQYFLEILSYFSFIIR